jgi:hypothetical protein
MTLLMPDKLLRASRITNKLAHISSNPNYCVEYHVGRGGFVEAWHCPHFEGRINRAPITQRWGCCHYLEVTQTYFTQPPGLLWDQVKHPACPRAFGRDELTPTP